MGTTGSVSSIEMTRSTAFLDAASLLHRQISGHISRALTLSRPQATGSSPSRPESNIEASTTGSDSRRPRPGPLRCPQRSTHHFPPDRSIVYLQWLIHDGPIVLTRQNTIPWLKSSDSTTYYTMAKPAPISHLAYLLILKCSFQWLVYFLILLVFNTGPQSLPQLRSG